MCATWKKRTDNTVIKRRYKSGRESIHYDDHLGADPRVPVRGSVNGGHIAVVYRFFVAVALVHYLLPRVLRPYFLLAASYGFFCYDPVNRPLVGVLLGTTAVSWLCGLIIGKVKVKPVRVLALLVTVLGGVGILVYYKYWNMLADTLGGSILSHRDNLLAPLGLSLLHLCGDELHHRCV